MTELSVNPTSSSGQIPQGQGTLPKFKKINEHVWKGLNEDEGQCVDVGNGVKIKWSVRPGRHLILSRNTQIRKTSTLKMTSLTC